MVVAGHENQIQDIIPDENPVKTSITNLCDAVDLLQLIICAANVPGARLHDLEKEAYEITVSLVEICQDVYVFYARCDTSCGKVLMTVKTAAGFHQDGLDDVAMKTLSTLARVSRDLELHCEKMIKKVDDAVNKIVQSQDLRAKIRAEMESNLDGRKELDLSKRKQELEITRRDEDLRAAEAGVAERKETYSADKKRSFNTAIVGEALGGASSLLSFGLAAVKAGSILSGIAAIGIPAALIGASAFLVNAYGKQISVTNAQQIADEVMLAERRKDEAEAQKVMLDLTLKLEKLESVHVDDALKGLRQVELQLIVLRSVLLEMKCFWELLASMFFPTVDIDLEAYSKIDANQLRRFFNSSHFEDVLKRCLQ
jgi:predicted phage tail protein